MRHQKCLYWLKHIKACLEMQIESFLKIIQADVMEAKAISYRSSVILHVCMGMLRFNFRLSEGDKV